MYCNHCGNEMPNGSKFCPKCGQNQTENEDIELEKEGNNLTNILQHKSMHRNLAEKILHKVTHHNFCCPRCGSHNVHVYKRGFSWILGFIGLFFFFFGFLIGFIGSNNLRYKCLDCGKEWK